MGFSWQEYWRWLSWPPEGILPDSGIEPASPALQADSLLTEPSGKPKKRREAKGKGVIERYTHLNVEFQRIAQR